ncbi:MAG: hypothetical protein GC179_27245 [Anaerolineaceae bacterium]|nr:hypothetical protein [Anaerolineaceae bacterium]
MNKKLLILFAVLAILLIGISAVGAQGNGNGVCDPQRQVTCPNNAQGNRGGMGFGNVQTNSTMSGRGQGNMSRGATQNGMGSFANLPTAYEGELPQEVIDLMISGWMDEQHAYAVYQGVIDQFGRVKPFVNIQRAEVQHIAAWEFLFDRYGIVTPEIPVIEVPQFASVSEACQLGAEAEVANFDLYDTMLTTFDPYPDIYQVALNLRNVSEYNHLPAFQQCSG